MEEIKHECGVAMVRLLKPLTYYKEKYGTPYRGINLMYLLMEKQHNRGQEGAGIGCVRLDVPPGKEYIWRERAEGTDAIQKIFASVGKEIDKAIAEGENQEDAPFVGEVYMGHLRYSTTGRSGISYVHPFMRRNNWPARNLLLCGNFNLTNVDEIFNSIAASGQHPRLFADTFILLEQLGHALDCENEALYRRFKEEGLGGRELSSAVSRNVDVAHLLKRCSPAWDGGYVICGIVGNGDMWAMRDPHGIRPAFYYADDEVVVIASERPVIQTALNLKVDEVKELTPGAAVMVDSDGQVRTEQILPEGKNSRCSFERIYFSRGSDADIYRERLRLGEELVDPVVKALDGDIDNAVFSFIPNTAEVAFLGLEQGLQHYLIEEKIKSIENLSELGRLTPESVRKILSRRVRNEKVAWKDIKMRTFIAQGDSRDDLAAHVYDITYNSLRPGVDSLVVIDDSIVRGTTLRRSIIRILDRLQPRKIVIVSSSPQVRYPDCYGIDMSTLGEFAAFRAAVALLRETGRKYILAEVYARCKEQDKLPKEQMVNCVKAVYEPFTDEEISRKIAEMLTPDGTSAKVEIVYQTVEAMHKAIPDNPGDWYFTGDYPTPGGNRLVNRAFINFYEGHADKRV